MAAVLPITLLGDNLGQRHRYLNLQVNHLVSKNVTFQEIEALPEKTSVDRLFKIDLAIKLKNYEYILKTLKDDDMLYVSRALKCKSLLKQPDLINPIYLEDVVFPEMTMPAISKMKHWLYINLKNEALSCQDFYLHYRNIKLEYAMKYLHHCHEDFVLREFPKLLTNVTPHHLKIFADKNTKLIKIYFDTLATNAKLVNQYLKYERKFYYSIKCVLKSDPDLFLDILEKYHNSRLFPKLSPSATDYIMRYKKERFLAKLELYVANFLHVPTMARRLSAEECQQVVIRLARANYIKHWFSYSAVEPLIKRLDKKDRAAFKKRVFVDKNIGEIIEECPYEFPKPPAVEISYNHDHIFHDEFPRSISMARPHKFCKMLKKRKYKKWGCIETCTDKSELQKLFDEFRFMGFKATIYELRDRLRTASSADRRRDMLLVLVSKSGGLDENVQEFLQLALKQRNEPVHIRAAIVRSLAKRSNVWRLSEDTWNMLLEYGVGLGLDGTKPEAECREGFHAVVLRQLLSTSDCDPVVRNAFLEDFTTLSEYKLTSTERKTVSISLQRILMTAAKNEDPEIAVSYLRQLLTVIKEYHANVKSSPVVSAIAELANRNQTLAIPLLKSLYRDRVGRRELFRQNLAFKHDDAALLNILRHDLTPLEPDWFLDLLLSNKTRANQFLLKLVVYFNETGGAAEMIRATLQTKVYQEFNIRLARPLAVLSSSTNILSMFNEPDKTDISDEHYKFILAVRANILRSRPAPDVLALGWRKVGLKTFAISAMRCRPKQVKQIVQMLLEDVIRPPLRLALALAPRTDCVPEIFATAVTIRPLTVLRAALLYFRHYGDAGSQEIWNIVKTHLSGLKLKHRKGLRHIIFKVEWIPNILKPNYCAMLYLALDEVSDRNTDNVVQDVMKYLPEISDDLLDEVLIRMLEGLNDEYPVSNPAVLIRYLMISKNVDQQIKRLELIGIPFLTKISTYRDANDMWRNNFFQDNFDLIITSLRYNYAFFDINNQNSIPIIENVLKWMQTFLSKDIYFTWYVKIHATMLYFKAVRQSVKQNREIFANDSRKMSEGVDIVGFIFGRYIAKEVMELKTKYFDSVVKLYSRALSEYFQGYNMNDRCRSKFIGATIKGIITENMGSEALLGVEILRLNEYYLKNHIIIDEINDLIMKTDDMVAQMCMFARNFDW